MKHFAGAPVVAPFVVEVRANLALTFALALLALVLAFPLPLLVLACLLRLLGLLGLPYDVLVMAVWTALAVRARLSITDIEARRLRFFFGGRSGERGRDRAVLVQLVELLILFVLPSLFEQEVTLRSERLVRLLGIAPKEDA